MFQTMVSVFCDDGVFHKVADILRQTHWWWTCGMCEGFHYAEILPRCIVCYIIGSDLGDALIEAEVFGKRTMISIITGSH